MDSTPRLINRSTGAYSLVDEDIAAKYTDSTIIRSAGGYIYINNVTLSHLVMGKPPSGFVIDHANLMKHDNRRSNLRIISRSHNSQNRAGRGKSKYKNVHWKAETGKWCVAIAKDYAYRKFGYFTTEEHAAYHANVIMKRLYGDSANLNKTCEGQELSKPYGYEEVIAAQDAKRNRDLPSSVSKTKSGYEVRFTVNKRVFRRYAKTLKEAVVAVEPLKKEAEDYKASLVPVTKYIVVKETTQDSMICMTSNGLHEFRISPHRYEEIKNFSWCLTTQGYIQMTRNQGNPTQKLHRFLMSAVEDSLIDHIDGNPKNNLDSNLRVATPAQNAQNRRSNGKSGYLGVTANEYGTYKVFISHQRVLLFLGSYPEITLAAWVYNQVATQLYGPDCGKNKDIEDYSDRYQVIETKNRLGNDCWRAVPIVEAAAENQMGSSRKKQKMES